MRLIVIVCLALLAGQTPQGHTGSISGVVTSRGGEPVKGMKIDASLQDGRPLSRALRFVETDSSGSYLIKDLEFGEYRVFAQAENLGYPNNHFDFYGGKSAPMIRLDKEHPRAVVNLILPPVAGKIRGQVRDRATGKPVENASIKLSRTDGPAWISTYFPVTKPVLVPADVPFMIEVKASGYKEWNRQQPVTVRSGAELTLDVLLDPVPKEENSSSTHR